MVRLSHAFATRGIVIAYHQITNRYGMLCDIGHAKYQTTSCQGQKV